jgi:hypothetical protein
MTVTGVARVAGNAARPNPPGPRTQQGPRWGHAGLADAAGLLRGATRPGGQASCRKVTDSQVAVAGAVIGHHHQRAAHGAVGDRLAGAVLPGAGIGLVAVGTGRGGPATASSWPARRRRPAAPPTGPSEGDALPFPTPWLRSRMAVGGRRSRDCSRPPSPGTTPRPDPARDDRPATAAKRGPDAPASHPHHPDGSASLPVPALAPSVWALKRPFLGFPDLCDAVATWPAAQAGEGRVRLVPLVVVAGPGLLQVALTLDVGLQVEDPDQLDRLDRQVAGAQGQGSGCGRPARPGRPSGGPPPATRNRPAGHPPGS